MALCNSGAMSLGGSTVGRSVNCELGCSGTAQIAMDDADVRGLAGVASGEIAMDDFYGASAGPETFGEVFEGGYYMGTICAAGSCYFLIMAPNSSGCACCRWKTTQTNSGVGCDVVNGFGNTYDHLANATHPAGNWTATRSIGGFSDWYLPARCELSQLYTNKGCSPAGQGFASDDYWASTEASNGSAADQNFGNGSIGDFNKFGCASVRAIRRVSF